jgi:hypothetical protein
MASRADRTTAPREGAKRPNTAVARRVDNPFTAAAAALGSDGGGVTFGKFNGNNGDFTIGSNPVVELPAGTLVLLDMERAVKRGWICWKEALVVDETMISITQGNPPREDELEDHSPYVKKDDGWKEQVSIRFKVLETGDEVELKMTSRAGIRGIGALLKAYGAEFRDHDPNALIVVELDALRYTPKDKSFGPKYAPILQIKEFISPDEAAKRLGITDDDDDDDDDAEDQAVAASDEGVIPVDDDDDDDGDVDADAPPVRQEAPQVQERGNGRRTRRI